MCGIVTHPCLSKHLQADTAPGGGGLEYSQIWSGAILGDGDRKHAPFVVLGLAP